LVERHFCKVDVPGSSPGDGSNIMENSQFQDWFNKLAEGQGFKEEKGRWIQKEKELTKVVELQKSRFGNTYYVNFGFIINTLPLGPLRTHIDYRFGTTDPEKRHNIDELLDLDSTLPVTFTGNLLC
jgi:hypothetical protein